LAGRLTEVKEMLSKGNEEKEKGGASEFHKRNHSIIMHDTCLLSLSYVSEQKRTHGRERE
jgi:hypothetical protein